MMRQRSLWKPTEKNIWSGRDDAEESGDTRRLHHIIHCLETPDFHSDGSYLPVLLGFSCDAGVQRNKGRVGASDAPDVLRRSLANLPLIEIDQLLDAGNIFCEGDKLEEAQNALAQHVFNILQHGGFPIILGGGHEVAWGSWQGLQRYLKDVQKTNRTLIINLDAHFDLRSSAQSSSGTPFMQIYKSCINDNIEFHYLCMGISEFGNTKGLFQCAKDIGVQYVQDTEMQDINIENIIEFLEREVNNFESIYLSLDFDVLPACVMPAVSAPASYGSSLNVVSKIIQFIASSKKLKIIDFAEFNPKYDVDSHGAKVASRLIYKSIICQKTANQIKKEI